MTGRWRVARASTSASSELIPRLWIGGWAKRSSPRPVTSKVSLASSLGSMRPIFRPCCGGSAIGCPDQICPGSIARSARSKNGSIQPCTRA